VNDAVTTVYVRTNPRPIPRQFREGLIVDYLNNLHACTLDANFEPIYRLCGMPTQAALDFALFASSVYVADKKVLRREQADAWTRNFYLSVPVYEPVKWQSVSESTAKMLSFLTGDRWRLSFRASSRWVLQPGLRLTDFSKSNAVCLFSGGLDSVVGAINLLESGRRILLIGHYDNNHTKKDQSAVFEELRDRYSSEIVGLVQVRVRPASKTALQKQNLPSSTENTTRSRSLVFLAVGLLAASAISPDTELFMPENGFVSLNVPLTPSRRGSNSTRTTHPHFLERLIELLTAIGLHNPVRNPFSTLTKGEIVKTCSNREALRRVVKLTVSCAHPEVLRFVRQPRSNCGYCYPCLIRRAALHAAELDASHDYGWDICTDAELIRHSRRGKDARAVFLSLNAARQAKPTLLSLASGGPINKPTTELQKLHRVYIRGLAEVETLFIEQATLEVLKLAGLG
jgi:7-cyano-7-deazaguanine synthase in queuosine biosynthesis